MHADTEDRTNKDAHSAAKQDVNSQQHQAKQTNQLLLFLK